MRKFLIGLLLLVSLSGCAPSPIKPQNIDSGVQDYDMIFNASLDTVGRIHDDEKNVTCYIYHAGYSSAAMGGIFCFVDSELDNE